MYICELITKLCLKKALEEQWSNDLSWCIAQSENDTDCFPPFTATGIEAKTQYFLGDRRD